MHKNDDCGRLVLQRHIRYRGVRNGVPGVENAVRRRHHGLQVAKRRCSTNAASDCIGYGRWRYESRDLPRRLQVEFREIESEPIPAVSEWGVAILALLMLTVATFVYGRSGDHRRSRIRAG